LEIIEPLLEYHIGKGKCAMFSDLFSSSNQGFAGKSGG
jgi:hypothetical protein